MSRIIKSRLKEVLVVFLALLFLFSGFPSASFLDYVLQHITDQNVVDVLYLSQKDPNVIDKGFLGVLKPQIREAHAANFQMQTGYYVGSGANRSITGVGFQPDFILIKSNNASGQAAFKTSAMTASDMAFTGATANNTSSQLGLDSDGFTLGTNASVNNTNSRYVWTAFSGSDCTSNGTFCVGQYTGNATSPRKIVTGFQPSLVIIKRSTAIASHLHTASEPNDEILYLTNTVRNTSGQFIQSFASDGFNVSHSGTTGDNVNGAVYNYVAFKTSAGVMAEGTYVGNATDNRNITGVGFQPDMLLVKNATNATANNTRPVMLLPESYGDSGSLLTATANTVNTIQALQSDGFQVGTSVFANGTGDTYYWAAFAGVPAPSGASGSFTMQIGSYTGNGTSQSITGVGCAPNLVMIKDNSTNYQVFRTSLMKGDATAYLSNAVANFTTGITSLDADGFSVGASTVVNTNANTYHYQAFCGAWNPEIKTGSADFAIGAYWGNGIDNRNIARLPWQPDFVATKRNNTSAGAWRSSALSGDLTSFFGATAEAANYLQALNGDGFQVGTNAVVNGSGSLYFWFGFKNGSGFATGTYTGNATDNRNITGVGFQPDLVWIKRSTAVNGVNRAVSLAGDLTQYFANLANVADRIQSFIADGFQIGGNQTETNTNGGVYRYAAWKAPVGPIISVSVDDGSVSYGLMAVNATKDTTASGLADTQTITNDGNVAIDVNIKGQDSANWVLWSTVDSNQYVHEFSINGGSAWDPLALGYQSLVTNLGVSATQDLDLQITTPTSTSNYSQQSVDVTIQAVQH